MMVLLIIDFMNSDSKMLLDKINKYLEALK